MTARERTIAAVDDLTRVVEGNPPRSHVVPCGVQQAEGMRPFAVLMSDAHDEPKPLVSFSGPVNLGLIVSVASAFEADGMRTVAKWHRNERGIICGLALVEVSK